jgi:ankyrin repeat protein
LLLQNGADPNATENHGRTPLYIAVGRQHHDITEVLLKHGARVTQTVLYLAADNEDSRSVELLLAACADPLARDRRREITVWLLDAFRTRSRVHMKTLLSMGKDVVADLPDRGRALLVEAIEDQKLAPFFELLLTGGADINAPNDAGSTLLHEATNVSRKRIKRLLALGADIEAKDHQGETALHRAACIRADVVSSLLESGAQANVANAEGDTPLHLAVDDLTVRTFSKRSLSSRARITELLIAHGANVNAVAHDGATPLQICRNPTLRKLLQDHGAVERGQFSAARIRRRIQ